MSLLVLDWLCCKEGKEKDHDERERDDLQKWNPTTLEAEAKSAVKALELLGIAAAAIEVNEIEEVLLAKIAVGDKWVAKEAKIFCFKGRFSDTACFVFCKIVSEKGKGAGERKERNIPR